VYGVIPRVMPLWISFSLYRFESSVCSATVLGIVGAGGIGVVVRGGHPRLPVRAYPRRDGLHHRHGRAGRPPLGAAAEALRLGRRNGTRRRAGKTLRAACLMPALGNAALMDERSGVASPRSPCTGDLTGKNRKLLTIRSMVRIVPEAAAPLPAPGLKMKCTFPAQPFSAWMPHPR